MSSSRTATTPAWCFRARSIRTPSVRSREALIEIYRKLRPGDPPTLETATALFNGMFFDPRKYDFSKVGRLKFNIKLGLETPLQTRTLDSGDFVAAIRYLLKLRKNIGTRGRHRPPGQPPRARGRRTARKPVPHRPGSHGARHQGKDVGVPGNVHRHAARPGQRQAGDGGDPRILRQLAAFAVHGPDQSAQRNHPQAAPLGSRAGRSVPRTRRIRSARRPPHALRPHLPDRNAGRSEHRLDQLAFLLRAHQRIRLHRVALPQGQGRARHRLRADRQRRRQRIQGRRNRRTRQSRRGQRRTEAPPHHRRSLLLLSLGVGRGPLRRRPGQRAARRARPHHHRTGQLPPGRQLRPEDRATKSTTSTFRPSSSSPSRPA